MEEKTQTNGNEADCREENTKKIQLEVVLDDEKFLALQALYRKQGLTGSKCALCTSRKGKIRKDHTASRHHVRLLSRFRAAFDVRGKRAICIACNLKVDWPEVSGHLEVHRVMPWYRPADFYEKLFSEGIWQTKKYFYCWVCEALMATWWEAYEHCDFEMHLWRNEDQTGWTSMDVGMSKIRKKWVIEGYSPDEDGKLLCRLCRVIVEIEDAEMHWKSAAHRMNTRMVDCWVLMVDATPSCADTAPSCKNASPFCGDSAPSCGGSPPSCGNDKCPRSSASLFKSATPTYEKPAPFGDNTAPSCARSNTKAKTPRRDEISLNPPNDLDAKSIDARTFLIGPHTLKLEISLKEKFVPERSQGFAFYCVICADQIGNIENAQDHVSGRIHAISMRKYGCKNIVSTANGYYCKCCDRKMDLLSLVYRHVLENEHSMKHAFGNFVETALREADDEEAPFRKHSGLENSTPSCNSSETTKKIVLSSSSWDDKCFLTGECPTKKDGPETPFREHSRDSSENSTPSCQRSNTVSKRANEIPPDSISGDSKSLNDSDARFLEDLTFLIGPQIPKLGKRSIKKLAVACNRGCILYCIVCDEPISSFKYARQHISGRWHAYSMKKNGCEYIRQIDDRYYCKCCDHKMKHVARVYHHVFSPRHTCSSKSSVPFRQVSNTSSKYPDKMSFDSICGDTKKSITQSLAGPNERFLKGLTFLIGPHTPEPGSKLKKKLTIARKCSCIFYCVICDESIRDINDARGHVSGRNHADSMEKYGCESIALVENGCYCTCCKRQMGGLSDAFDHVMKNEHVLNFLKNLAVPNAAVAQKIAEECSTTKNGFETPSFSAKSTEFCENAVPSCNESSRTSENSTQSQKGSGATPLGVSFDHIKQLGPNKYTCRICGRGSRLSGNVHDHVLGRRHQQSLKRLGSEAPQQNDGQENSDVERASSPNIDNGSLKRVCNRKFDDASSFFKVKRDTGKPKTAARPENKAAPRNSRYNYIAMTSFVTMQVKMKCSICIKVVSDSKSLHSHLASHFSDYFTSAIASKNSNLIETSILELDDDCALDDDRMIDSLSPLPEFFTLDKPPKMIEKSKRDVNIRKTLQILDFDEDAIYAMIDKMADYELCSKLCLIVDSSTIYCLVCREPVPNTFQSFYDHLSSLDHCAYLEMMENDAARYARYVDQFSDLDLAHEYMEDYDDEIVRCYACGVSVANKTEALRAHIDEAGHSEACKALRTGAAGIADILMPRASCDWYRVQLYWCVPCLQPCRNEVTFVAHFESPKHLEEMNKRAANVKTMLLDYCQSCALLWYGYRVTRCYHERTSAHVVLARDGHYATRPLSKLAMSLLAKPEVYADARIRRLDELEANEASKQRDLLKELEDIVRIKFPNAKAYTFGSRFAGLSSENSDIDVYLDCRNTYDGSEFEFMTSYFIKEVYDCLCNYPNTWDVDELLMICKVPIIRAHHRETDLKCDLSFQNGLGVENTKMIRAYCTVYPPCRKLILILRQWLAYCNLADSNIIKNYCISWIVIFYLQSISILPSVATLVKMRNKSRTIAGWEVGVSHEFDYYEAHLDADDSSPIVRLLKGFFSFYAAFDFRREVVCPLLGYPILKRDFIVSKNLSDAMKPYKQYVSVNPETGIFPMDTPMCVQDPFRMNDNLATSVGKRHLNAFRVLCAESLNFISSL